MGTGIVFCLCVGVIAVCIAQILKDSIDYQMHLEGAKECYDKIFPWIEGDRKFVLSYQDEQGNIQRKEITEEMGEFRIVFKVYDIWLIKDEKFVSKIEVAERLREILQMAKAYVENNATPFRILTKRDKDIEQLKTLYHNVSMYLYRNI